MAKEPTFPQTPDDWRAVIASDFGLSIAGARQRYVDGTFPYAELKAWMARQYDVSQGYVAGFVPALHRNVRGLVAWAYGDADEPYWPGSDDTP